MKTSNFFHILALALSILLLPLSAASSDWIYTVSPGDNLWNFSEKHLDNVLRYEKLRKLNNIENPTRMKPGTKIRVPLKWIRSNPVPAEISGFKGSAQLFRADGSVIDINEKGVLVYLGDQIKTGDESTVAIKFADDSVLTLHANSLIRFDHLSAHGETGMVDSRLNLLEGRMDTRVTPAAGPGSRFEIYTPSAIAAVRGTEYRAAVSEAELSSSIEVLHGKVAVKGAKKQRLIKAGFGTKVAKGKQPIAPKKLLNAPKLNSLPGRIRTIGWTLSWEKLTEAAQYRVEVSEEEAFNTILWQKKTEYAKVGLPDLLDGRYFVRVRGIDSLGLEGKQQVTPFVMDTRPQPPVQLKPTPAQVFRATTPELQWSDSAEADRYHLEIASDKAFTELIVDEKNLKSTKFDTSEWSKIQPYYWRLTSITTEGEFGPVGETRSYEIKPIPEKVTTEMNTSDDGMLVASWRAGAPGLTYHVQMAEDPAFKDTILD
ncbi:MAG: LysM peptidoglycan-binding domain-containing protein, partial [Gammaproteobacteria bacterium]|nr:LysM peptidoglycan-binding domain-containing protein [Gammaproteobacteria bacterium]